MVNKTKKSKCSNNCVHTDTIDTLKQQISFRDHEIGLLNGQLKSKGDTLFNIISNYGDMMSEDRKILRMLVILSNTTIQRMVDALTFMKKKYDDVICPPPRKTMNDVVIKHLRIITFMENIIRYNDHDILYKFLCHLILLSYGKAVIDDDQVWINDLCRFTSFTHEIIGAIVTKKTFFLEDDEMYKCIIYPLLVYIKELFKEYKICRENFMSKQDTSDFSQKVEDVKNVLDLMESGELEKQMIEYLSPYFVKRLLD